MYRVVVVDDEVLIHMYVREILENNGYEVVGVAEDGLDAINVCREQRPDFVIMDIRIPVLSGLEATKMIIEEKLAGFVIMLTACRDRNIAQKAVDIGAMGYIVKPVCEDSLLPAVEIAINEYKRFQAMEKEVIKAKESLDDRKFVDRAKGILMERKKMTENEAYTYLRKLAMDKEKSIGEVSKILIKAFG